jgi:cell division protein FtsB
MTAFALDRQDRRLKLVLAVLLLILLLLQVRLWSGAGSLAHIDQLDREIVVQQADNFLLMERNDAMRQEVNDLKNGMDAIEERARSRLGLIRKGETFILITERDPTPLGREQGASNALIQENPDLRVQQDSVTDEVLMETLPPSLDTDELERDPVGVDPIP